MSGQGSFKWTDEQRHALERRVLDEQISVAQTVREAHAGELRRELAGPKLPPFEIPLSSVHHIIKTERRRRRDLHKEAAAITDPETAYGEMSRLLLAETKAELLRMSKHLRHPSLKSKRAPAWPELTQAAKTLDLVGKAALPQRRHQEPPNGNQTQGPSQSQKPPPEPKSLVARLAAQRDKKPQTPTDEQEATDRPETPRTPTDPHRDHKPTEQPPTPTTTQQHATNNTTQKPVPRDGSLLAG